MVKGENQSISRDGLSPEPESSNHCLQPTFLSGSSLAFAPAGPHPCLLLRSFVSSMSFCVIGSFCEF